MKTKTKKLKSRATHSHKLTKFHEQLKRIEREQYIDVWANFALCSNCVGGSQAQYYPHPYKWSKEGPGPISSVRARPNIRGQPAEKWTKLPSEEKWSILMRNRAVSEDNGHFGTFVRGIW